MKHARLALFDDEEQTFNEVRDVLKGTPHRIETWAATRGYSLDTLDELYAGRVAIDAILLDGKMDSGDFSDAIAIEHRARKLFGNSLPIIGWSIDELAGRVIPLHHSYDLGKTALPRLVKFLDEMPETELQKIG